MKKLTIIVGTLFLMSTCILVSNPLWAKETSPEEVEQGFKEVGKAVAEKMREKQTDTETPFMGVYLDDLDFEDAYEMHYDYNYGVLLDGVVKGGPADKAGLMEEDIIMEFDGVKARYEDHLRRLIKSKNVGDSVKVKYFRDENIMTTTLTLGSRKPKKEKEYEEITKEGKVIRKKKLSVGYGGGSWIPVWYMPDIKVINKLLLDLDFKEETFSEDGFLLQGGGGKGTIGKGWFIGGMGAGFEDEATTKHDWIHYKEGVLDTSTISRKAEYKISFGGVTLDKRFAISRKFVGSFGFLLGTGKNSIKISQTDDNGEIPNFDFEDDPSGQMDEYYDYKSNLSLEQKFIVFQPKVMMMYRINSWLGIRAEAGYMASYSSKGWKAKRNGESIKIDNEPDTNMNGYTFTIGPWFGF